MFVTHVPTVVVAVTLPDAADAAAIGAAILVWQTAVFWSRRNMQTCKLLIVGGFVSVYLTTRVFQKQYVLILTRLDAGVVVELVALGTLTLQLSAGRR